MSRTSFVICEDGVFGVLSGTGSACEGQVGLNIVKVCDCIE